MRKERTPGLPRKRKSISSPFDKELQSSTSVEWNYVEKRIYQYSTYATFKVLHERKIKIGQETERNIRFGVCGASGRNFFFSFHLPFPTPKKAVVS